MRAPAQRSCGAPVRQGDVTAVGPLRNRRGWVGTKAARVSVAPSSPVGAAPPAAFRRPDPGAVRIANRAWIARTRFRSENETQASSPTWPLTCTNAGGRDRRRSGDLPLFRWPQLVQGMPTGVIPSAKDLVSRIARHAAAEADTHRPRDARGIFAGSGDASVVTLRE